MADDPAVSEPIDPVDPSAGDPPADPPAAPPADPAKGNGEDVVSLADYARDHIQDTRLRNHAGQFTSVLDLVGKHFELRQSLSTAIQPLGKDATDEQVATYRERMGVPKTAEEYKFPGPPEGEEHTDEVKASHATWAERFHRLHVPVNTAAELVALVNEDGQAGLAKQIADDKAYADEQTAELKADMPGKEFELNKMHADRAATKLFGDALDEVRKIETKGGRFVLDNPIFFRMLAGIGREMSEGRLGTVMTEGDEAALDTEIENDEKAIEKAQAEGDYEKANKIYQQQQDKWRKKIGDVPIVGAEGRTA